MQKGNKPSSPIPSNGGASIMITFAALCMAVFAAMSLSTVRSDASIATRSMDAAYAYYEADAKAQATIAALRLQDAVEYELTKNLDGTVEFDVPVSDVLELHVRCRVGPGTDYEIIEYATRRSVPWEPDLSMPVFQDDGDAGGGGLDG